MKVQSQILGEFYGEYISEELSEYLRKATTVKEVKQLCDSNNRVSYGALYGVVTRKRKLSERLETGLIELIELAVLNSSNTANVLESKIELKKAV